jgi:hypothetical protein
MTPQQMLDLYIAAEAAVLEGKEYQDHRGRVFKREDLKEIRAGRIEWQHKVAAAQRAAANVSSLSVKTANFDVY